MDFIILLFWACTAIFALLFLRDTDDIGYKVNCGNGGITLLIISLILTFIYW